MQLNMVILSGNLTRDVELRHTQGGTAIAKFGLAINERYTSNGEKKERTAFLDCVAWGKTGELIAQYLKKGSPIFIEKGRLDYQTWDDRESGKRRSKIEVVVERFQFMGGGGAKSDDAPAKSREEPRGDVDYGDIPF